MVDGWSRKILWIGQLDSNNDPTVIADIYLSIIADYGGIPVLMVSDAGSENVLLQAIHAALRFHHDDDLVSTCVRIVPSTRNTRAS